jgi:hypothetical protein
MWGADATRLETNIYVIECPAEHKIDARTFVQDLAMARRMEYAKFIVLTSQFHLFFLLSRELVAFPNCLIIKRSNAGQLQTMKFVCIRNVVRLISTRLDGKFGLRFQTSRGSIHTMDNRDMVVVLRVIAAALCINVLVNVLQWWGQPAWAPYLNSIAGDLHALATKR